MKKLLSTAILVGFAGHASAFAQFRALSVSAPELEKAAAADGSLVLPSKVPAAEKAKGGSGKLEFGFISAEERNAYIKKASLWIPEDRLDTPSIDFRKGPSVPFKYEVEELVNCTYIPSAEAYEGGKANGTTPKFKCMGEDGKKFKVKYGGRKNGEVISEVAVTWILTAIGAYADRMYPVRLNCPDCPSDPFKDESDRGAWENGQAIAIEEKIAERLESSDNSGIGFNEFHLIEDRVGAEALTGIAHFFGNTDNKAQNQALACQKKDIAAGADGKAKCLKPIAYMQDSGVTLGGRGLFHNSRVNYDGWKGESVWLNPSKCIMRLHLAQTSTIKGTDPEGRDMHQIGEQARQMLVRRFSLLSREQLTEIFRASGAPWRAPHHSAEEWADLFLDKVQQLRDPMGDGGNFACPYDIVPPGSAGR